MVEGKKKGTVGGKVGICLIYFENIDWMVDSLTSGYKRKSGTRCGEWIRLQGLLDLGLGCFILDQI